MIDAYGVLGVDSIASTDEIRRAYCRLARVLHPDKNEPCEARTATENFQRLHEAYELLKDTTKRAMYDRDRPSFYHSANNQPKGTPYGNRSTREDRTHAPDRPHNPQKITTEDIKRLTPQEQVQYVFGVYKADAKRRIQRHGWKESDVFALLTAVIVEKLGGKWKLICNRFRFTQNFDHLQINDKWKNVRKQLSYVGIDDIWT